MVCLACGPRSFTGEGCGSSQYLNTLDDRVLPCFRLSASRCPALPGHRGPHTTHPRLAPAAAAEPCTWWRRARRVVRRWGRATRALRLRGLSPSAILRGGPTLKCYRRPAFPTPRTRGSTSRQWRCPPGHRRQAVEAGGLGGLMSSIVGALDFQAPKPAKPAHSPVLPAEARQALPGFSPTHPVPTRRKTSPPTAACWPQPRDWPRDSASAASRAAR